MPSLSLSLFAATSPADAPANILAAARALTPHLARSRPLDRRLVASVMTTCFGGTDAEGAWSWRDAYDAIEAAQVLQLRRLSSQLGRLEDAPAEIAALLAGLSALTLTHTRRSEEQIALDQFSTPPPLAALAVLAAQVRPGDRVLEPSAGTGLLAIVAEACGAELHLNEVSAHRAALLDGLFPGATRTRHDAAHLADLLPVSGSLDAVVCNPPFSALHLHLLSALACLAEGGRLSAIVPVRAFSDAGLMASVARRGEVVAALAFPQRAYAKHGTSVETGLLVVDRRVEGAAWTGRVTEAEELADAARAAAALPARPTAKPRRFRETSVVSLLRPKARELALPSGRLAFLAGAAPVDYGTRDWTGEGHDVGLYQAYGLARIVFAESRPHPSALVESGSMASVPPPAPSYRPVLPSTLRAEARISDAQAETVVYAGEAHAAHLPGSWILGEAAHEVALVPDDHAAAVRFRRGMMLGDGTGCGKGRQIAAVIADNMAQGRLRAVWLSRNDSLLEDARRDWRAIGGGPTDIVSQGSWRQADAIRLDRGVLFSTYATLRQPARGDRPSRLDQMVAWLGADFDGVIALDECHALANAGAGGKTNRGSKKASLQGMAGLALQNRLPDARVLYVSATGATQPENLAYAARLGLWGGPEAPFTTRADFMDAVDRGGVAVMELLARELKAMGLYVARSLSFEGVEYEPLRHPLTPENVEVWNEWADAFQRIHANLEAALQAVGIKDEDGDVKSGQALAQVRSAFEGAKLRFFAHLLAGMKSPTLIASIRQDLAEGRSAVVQIVSTNEAVMERRLAEVPPEEWNNLSIDLTPKEYVLDYLKGAFPVILQQAIDNEDGSVSMVPVMADGVPVVSQEALAIRDDLVGRMACLPAVPSVLDALLDRLGPDVVAEITGRSRRVVARDGRRVVERRSASAAKAETDAFMAGRKRVLVFSDAGGTGRSYHADLGAQNQQRRVHYLVEPGWRADAAIQGLGRTHRTHQASAPLFRPVCTDVHGEKRFLSTIARRLDSLGALTRGERRTAGNGLFSADDNLETSWARHALIVFYGALGWGELDCMTCETFETKTGLKLRTSDGDLKDSEQLPPMNTFLNRLLALRIEDQNALFADYDRILQGVLERAAASGELDRGLEDIVADDLKVVSEEVVRTDAGTGAETRLVTFEVRTRRELLSAEAALARVDPAGDAVRFAVNEKSGRAALVELGLTTTDDNDRMVRAVRLVRPDRRSLTPLKSHEESAWREVDVNAWRSAWDAEIAGADPWRTRTLTLVTGLLLPIWTHLPSRGGLVRRVKAPDGRRWLGRVLDEVQVQTLKVALGLTDIATVYGDGGRVAAMILDRNASFGLSGGLWARRARVMDRQRIEIVGGAAHRAALTAIGCFTEIIAYSPRVFAPVDKPEVLAAVLRRFPVEHLLEGAAA